MIERLCIIAGRGGSKRLPGKNLLFLCGKPLIAHTIEQAKKSGQFSAIAVTSDNQEILDVSKQFGADIIIKRPPELATDEANSLDVIKHVIDTVEFDYKTIVFLQITSPLRLPQDITKAIQIFEEKPSGSLLSVVKEKRLSVEIAGSATTLPDFGKNIYNINGSIYIWDKERFLQNPQHIYPDSRLMVMPKVRSVDIDFKSDFIIAETLMETGEYKLEESYSHSP